jgi:hypothetical protein
LLFRNRSSGRFIHRFTRPISPLKRDRGKPYGGFAAVVVWVDRGFFAPIQSCPTEKFMESVGIATEDFTQPLKTPEWRYDMLDT